MLRFDMVIALSLRKVLSGVVLIHQKQLIYKYKGI